MLFIKLFYHVCFRSDASGAVFLITVVILSRSFSCCLFFLSRRLFVLLYLNITHTLRCSLCDFLRRKAGFFSLLGRFFLIFADHLIHVNRGHMTVDHNLLYASNKRTCRSSIIPKPRRRSWSATPS